MYKVKNAGRIGRTMKRKTNMMAKLAHMTQMLIVSPSTSNIGTTTELRQGIMSRMAEAPVPSSGGSSAGESS